MVVGTSGKHGGFGHMSRAVSHHCPLFQLHPGCGGSPWRHAVPRDLPPPPGTPCPEPNPLLLPRCPGAVNHHPILSALGVFRASKGESPSPWCMKQAA